MTDLRPAKAVLIVFAMPGCPACDDYLPRFKRQVAAFQQYGHRFAFRAAGQPVERGTIPIFVYDASSPDPGLQQLADQYGVSGVPATILLTRYHGTKQLDGSVPDSEIYDTLLHAAQVNL